MRVTFNKVMDGTTIELPASAGQSLCAAADGITVTLRALPDGVPVDVTRPDPARTVFPNGMNVCCIPNSSNANWSASLSASRKCKPPFESGNRSYGNWLHWSRKN